MSSPVASTSVLIIGPETTVGSMPTRAAASGNSDPIDTPHKRMAEIECAVDGIKVTRPNKRKSEEAEVKKDEQVIKI